MPQRQVLSSLRPLMPFIGGMLNMRTPMLKSWSLIRTAAICPGPNALEDFALATGKYVEEVAQDLDRLYPIIQKEEYGSLSVNEFCVIARSLIMGVWL